MMITRICSNILVFSAAVLMATQVSVADVTVQHFWDFEGGFADKIGSADGVAGATVSTGTGFNGGTAMSTIQDVVNANDYVEIDASQLFVPGTNAFAVSYWMNIGPLSGVAGENVGIFDLSANGGDGIQALYISGGANGDNLANRVDGTSAGAAAFAPDLDNSSWRFVVANYDPSSGIQVHVDGFGVVGSVALNAGNVVFGSNVSPGMNPDLYLGAFNVNGTATFRGLGGNLLDDLAVYSGTLAEQDINDLFSGAKDPFDFQAIPEPGTASLISLLALSVLIRRKRTS